MRGNAGIKVALMWSYVRGRARLAGIDAASLSRVHAFIRSKFGHEDRAHGRAPRQAHFPGLQTRPVYEPSAFSWVETIERSAGDIKREFDALRARGLLTPHPQQLADAGEWNTYYLFSNGVRFDAHCRACPATAEVVGNLPGGVMAGQAYFSVMAPGTHVRPHHGPTNTRLRCHLGLEASPSSRIRVATEELRWMKGRCIVFDDSFEHEVWNPEGERAVFIVDVWHPELSEAERWALGQLARMSRRNKRYRNGAANRAHA